jgi:hypothetical protein
MAHRVINIRRESGRLSGHSFRQAVHPTDLWVHGLVKLGATPASMARSKRNAGFARTPTLHEAASEGELSALSCPLGSAHERARSARKRSSVGSVGCAKAVRSSFSGTLFAIYFDRFSFSKPSLKASLFDASGIEREAKRTARFYLKQWRRSYDLSVRRVFLDI